MKQKILAPLGMTHTEFLPGQSRPAEADAVPPTRSHIPFKSLLRENTGEPGQPIEQEKNRNTLSGDRQTPALYFGEGFDWQKKLHLQKIAPPGPVTS